MTRKLLAYQLATCASGTPACRPVKWRGGVAGGHSTEIEGSESPMNLDSSTSVVSDFTQCAPSIWLQKALFRRANISCTGAGCSNSLWSAWLGQSASNQALITACWVTRGALAVRNPSSISPCRARGSHATLRRGSPHSLTFFSRRHPTSKDSIGILGKLFFFQARRVVFRTRELQIQASERFWTSILNLFPFREKL